MSGTAPGGEVAVLSLDPFGRLLDVVADPEDLLEHDDPGANASLRQRHVRVELAVGGAHAFDPYRACHGVEAYPATRRTLFPANDSSIR